ALGHSPDLDDTPLGTILHAEQPVSPGVLSAAVVNVRLCTVSYGKELSCQHHYHLVESWCSKYIETARRCPPTIVSRQYWGNEICSACRERQQPSHYPWIQMMQRRAPKTDSYHQDQEQHQEQRISAR
ncbi:hypothetical protein E4U42_007207, partial [Claviceps africana]